MKKKKKNLDTIVYNPNLLNKWGIFGFLKSFWLLVCIRFEILSLSDHTDAAAFEISWLQKQPALLAEVRDMSFSKTCVCFLSLSRMLLIKNSVLTEVRHFLNKGKKGRKKERKAVT